jgi:hypothetical protein
MPPLPPARNLLALLGALFLTPAIAGDLPGLKVDPSGHFLVTAEGKPFVWQGDTVWGALSLKPEEIDHYLEVRQAQGFNVIQLMTHRTAYDGQEPFAQKDPVILNEAYWSRIDSLVAKATARRMYVCLFLMWGSNADTLFPNPSLHNYQYGKLVGQRYADRPAVLFAGSGEYHKIVAPDEHHQKAPPGTWTILLTPEQVALVARIGEGLEAGHGGNRLNTMHPNAGGTKHATGSSSQHFHASPWLDFTMIQTWGDLRYAIALVRSDYDRTPAKPTLNGEPGYEERHLNRHPKDGIIDAWHCRVEAYWALFSGACGHTYGNSFVYFPTPTWKTALHSTAADDMRHWRRLLESRSVLIREPNTTLIVSPPGSFEGTARREPGNYRLATRAADGSYAFVYSTRGLDFTVDLGRISGREVRAWWLNPRDGQCYDEAGRATTAPCGTYPTSGPRTFDPPGEAGPDHDWVLVLDDASHGYGIPGDRPRTP